VLQFCAIILIGSGLQLNANIIVRDYILNANRRLKLCNWKQTIHYTRFFRVKCNLKFRAIGMPWFFLVA